MSSFQYFARDTWEALRASGKNPAPFTEKLFEKYMTWVGSPEGELTLTKASSPYDTLVAKIKDLVSKTEQRDKI